MNPRVRPDCYWTTFVLIRSLVVQRETVRSSKLLNRGMPVELEIWSKVAEKRGTVLVIRGDELHRIGVVGMAGKPGREVPRIIEALRQGQEPSTVGAGSVETLKLSAIGRAEVTPEQYTVKFIAEGDNGATLEYSSNETNGAEIARAVLARAGRPFREEKHEIGPVEAVMPPIVTGVIVGIFWALLYGSAGQIEAGEEIAIRPGRHSGKKQLFVTVASMLGVKGTIILGVVLLMLILGWATMRVVRRPQRTVWLPE